LKTSRAVVSRAGRGRRGSAAEVGIELGNRGVEEIDLVGIFWHASEAI
jgi:hypothetical protein